MLTDAQRELAERLQARAEALRAACEDGLSVAEAVELAAVQLGLQPPTAPDPAATLAPEHP
jgi:DNA-binding MarR family transcriptional regulator